MSLRTVWNGTTIALSLVLIAGCSSSMSSPERHAKHFIYTSDDGFDPNFATRKQQSVKFATPFFDQFWEEGKKDREKGLTKEDVKQRVNYFSSDEFFNSFQNISMFAGKAYDRTSRSLKWRKAMSEAASSTYLDGYEGRN
ncbi:MULTISPECIES: Exc2 family lipoprotein [unclassified Serratia (in: enterobacteria)]|uniref:Exc2 family lipoprotein n=1 Tax=unclassified Serratia (in: enterobacteria) TaxID=2647522 RepID=UPI002ED2D6E0|nr:Exc2 family lipoprotein [Serratia sp. C2(2)]MEE4449881.1 Exc2 family lipoprotein [Serratia sp. C2(1)]